MNEITRKDISFNIPAFLSVPQSSKFNEVYKNEFVTHARLKVFYVGQTGDKRLFTEKFSEKLLKTLPQTPVVAFFDKDKDDFVGHNATQYVYGYVPETAEFSLEEDEDGVKWAFTDVVLFTGRQDNIGEVAAKIVGKQHSLELDPDSVDYKVNRFADGKLKNIEFTEGKLVGLSVLADSETPAFSGSGFFSKAEPASIEELISRYKDIKELDLGLFSPRFEQKNENGGVIVEEILTQEQTQPVVEQVEQVMEEVVVETPAEPEQVVEQVEQVENNVQEQVTEVINNHLQYAATDVANITASSINIALPNSNTAGMSTNTLQYVQHYQAPQITLKEVNNFMRETLNEKMQRVHDALTENLEAYIVEVGDDQLVYVDYRDYKYYRVTYKVDKESVEFGEPVKVRVRYLTDEEIDATFTNKGQGAELEEKTSQTDGVFFTKSEKEQIDSDRAELEGYRKSAKYSIIEKFKQFLTEEEVVEFKKDVANHSIENLEKELSFAAMKKVLENKQEINEGKNVGVFSVRGAAQLPENEQDKVKNLINKLK